MTQDAYIAIGSNLGDRAAYLRQAVRSLDAAGGNNVTACSPVYETEALILDDAPQPPYLNAVVRLSTMLSPTSLLMLCHEIELAAGRIRDGRRWAPRTLDLDILLLGSLSVSTPVLTIPHRELVNRRFVLKPLSDIAPDLVLPDPINKAVADALADCADSHDLKPYDNIFAANPSEPAPAPFPRNEATPFDTFDFNARHDIL